MHASVLRFQIFARFVSCSYVCHVFQYCTLIMHYVLPAYLHLHVTYVSLYLGTPYAYVHDLVCQFGVYPYAHAYVHDTQSVYITPCVDTTQIRTYNSRARLSVG